MLLKPEMPSKQQVWKAALVLALTAVVLAFGAAILLFAKFVGDRDDPSGRWNAIMLVGAIVILAFLNWIRPWVNDKIAWANDKIDGHAKDSPSR